MELWRLLDTRQRRGFLLAQALALVMAASTVAGVAAVVPFFTVLGIGAGLVFRFILYGANRVNPADSPVS